MEMAPQTDAPAHAPTGKAAESDLKSRMVKLTLTLLGVIVLVYMVFYGFRKTPLYKQLAINPVRVKSVMPLGGKVKLVLVEAYGSHLLLGSSDTQVNLLKTFSPEYLRHYELEQKRIEAEHVEFETAMGKKDDTPEPDATPSSSK